MLLALIITLGGAAFFGIAGFFFTGSAFWACYWLFWFFGVFLIPELYWVFTNASFTVTEETWHFEDLNRSHPYDFSQWTAIHWVFAVFYFIFMFMLGLHLVFGKFS